MTPRGEADLAHGCFLFAGLATLLIVAASAAPMHTGEAGVFGFFVAIPLTVASLAAICGGVALTARHRRPTLLTLSLISTLMVIDLFVEFSPPGFRKIAPALYGVLVVVLCTIWFAALRRGEKDS